MATGHWLTLVSTVITFASLALSLNASFRLGLPDMWLLQAQWFWMVVYALAVLVITLNTAKRMLNEVAAKLERDFYAGSFKARRERGHYLFYEFALQAQLLLADKASSLVAWQRWDQQVRAAMTDHCSHNILYAYLQDTNRLGDRIDDPLSADYYQRALECIQRNVLDSTMENVFR